MTTTLAAPATKRGRKIRDQPPRPSGTGRPNWVGAVASFVWLAIVLVPIYWIIITSFKDQNVYFSSNPFLPPTSPTAANYAFVIESGFARFFLNSVIVTVGAMVPAVLLSFVASFAIVRGTGWVLKGINSMFLMGLAIPLQATIIPVYLIIIRLGLYDSLAAIILPSIAFALPLSVLVLTNFIRDVPKELFESMRVDGASDWNSLWHLAFPLVKPALVTVTVYNGLNVWNGFLLPLILTQSPEKRVLPLGLWSFQGQYSVNVPAVLASVVLTTLPILVLYVIGRRQLVSGMTAGFSK